LARRLHNEPVWLACARDAYKIVLNFDTLEFDEEATLTLRHCAS